MIDIQLLEYTGLILSFSISLYADRLKRYRAWKETIKIIFTVI